MDLTPNGAILRVSVTYQPLFSSVSWTCEVEDYNVTPPSVKTLSGTTPLSDTTGNDVFDDIQAAWTELYP